MSEDKGLSRREFTVASALAMLSGVAITISAACGGGSSPSSPSPNPTPNPTPAPTPTPTTGDKVGSVSNNHGHVAVITGARLTEGGALSLDIRGTATHTHTVELTAADMTAIAGNQRVAKDSTTDSAHSHTVTFN
jgi:hypothetical protein